jgi:hypothetical protein
MPRIPPVIDGPPSCSFATIRRPKTEEPRAKPTKFIEVDIFCSRLCVLILIPVVDLAAPAARCSSSRVSSTYKGVRKPEFQKIRRIKVALFIRSALRRSKIFSILVRYVVPSDVPVKSYFFSFLLLLAAPIVEHTSLWNGTTVCQGPAGRLRATRWSVVLLSAQIAAEGRLSP